MYCTLDFEKSFKVIGTPLEGAIFPNQGTVQMDAPKDWTEPHQICSSVTAVVDQAYTYVVQDHNTNFVLYQG